MTAKKLSTTEKYKVAGIGVALLTILSCQFARVHGKFVPIVVPEELWTILSVMLTHLFMSVTQINVKLAEFKAMPHVRGLVAFVMLLAMGASIYFNIPLGSEWWSLIGIVVTFLYNSSSSSS